MVNVVYYSPKNIQKIKLDRKVIGCQWKLFDSIQLLPSVVCLLIYQYWHTEKH